MIRNDEEYIHWIKKSKGLAEKIKKEVKEYSNYYLANPDKIQDEQIKEIIELIQNFNNMEKIEIH